MTLIRLTAAKLTRLCNTLQTSYSFARSGTGVVSDREPNQSRMCKTSLLFAALPVHVHADSSPIPFYTPTKPVIRVHIKFKTVLNLS